jgi:hypothetical protein
MPYIGTTEVDKTYEQALRLGAKPFVEPTDIPTVGRFGVLADPQGATFALFTPAALPADVTGPPQMGDFSWHELVTTDHPAASDFYHALFGWEKTGAHDMGPMGEYLLFGQAGKAVGGMYEKPKDVQAPPHWLCYVRVDDAASVAARVAGAGGRLLHGPAQAPGGDWIAQLLDPQGAAIAVVSTPRAAVARKPGRPKKGTVKKKGRPPAKKAPRRKAARKKVSARKAPARKAARRTRKPGARSSRRRR